MPAKPGQAGLREKGQIKNIIRFNPGIYSLMIAARKAQEKLERKQETNLQKLAKMLVKANF